MELKIANDVNDLARHAEAWLEQRAHSLALEDVFLPAGSTCRPLYARWRKQAPAFVCDLRFAQVDEIATGARQGAFEAYFREELPSLAPRFRWARECRPPAQAAILGFGRNGHVAFHEPGLDPTFSFGCVKLADETVKNLGLEPRSWGLSYGLGAFNAARAVLLLVSGAGKTDAFRGFLVGDPSVPATFMKNHPDLTVIVDKTSVPGF